MTIMKTRPQQAKSHKAMDLGFEFGIIGANDYQVLIRASSPLL
jgi:hypothetical protein